MDLKEAKRISIVEFLRERGCEPVKETRNESWFRSPLRDEKTASFCVSRERNVWFDFGTGEGGTFIDLALRVYRKEVQRIVDNRGVSEVTALLGVLSNDNSRLKRLQLSDVPAADAGDEFLNVASGPLVSPCLLSYLRDRQISPSFGQRFCCEVNYLLRRKRYFGIGFKNDSGGFEVRNAYFKGCLIAKDISTVTEYCDVRSPVVCVFEGFMDFLSFLTLREKCDELCSMVPSCDFIIMNSVYTLNRLVVALQDYKEVFCFLDNDTAGRTCTETIAGCCPGTVHDMAPLYKEFKDVNDYLRGKRM